MIKETRNFIIKLVFRSLKDALQAITQIISIQEGEIRSLYLSPKGMNGVREMMIEYEGGISTVNLLIKKVTESEGCIKAIVSEFPAELIHPSGEVYE